MRGNRLYKKEKLCSHTAIERLFSHSDENKKSIAYPLRLLWNIQSDGDYHPNQFIIVVPKRRLKHAVDRVLMRRRIREAYRLNRHKYLGDGVSSLRLAFVYVADCCRSYAAIEKSLQKLLKNVVEDFQEAR